MTFDLSLMIFFGAVGYLMRKFEYEASSLILAFTAVYFPCKNIRGIFFC
jgi:TctA family transporter